MNKTTMYLVSDGCYSSYRILGVYSTKENAQKAHQLFRADNDIEEYVLDEMPEHPPGVLHYRVDIDRDGDVKDVRKESVEEFPDYTWAPYGQFRDFVHIHVWAEDEKHAVKIANEMRVRLIVLGEWTTDFCVWAERHMNK